MRSAQDDAITCFCQLFSPQAAGLLAGLLLSEAANDYRRRIVTEKKIIAVVGATGAQGGGLVRAILADKGGPFRPRALTRDVNSPKAQALAAAGAELATA